MLFFPLPSINIAAKPSPESPLVTGDFLDVGFVGFVDDGAAWWRLACDAHSGKRQRKRVT